MAETVTLYPVVNAGRTVYIAPVPFSIQPSGLWLVIVALLVIVVVLAMRTLPKLGPRR